MVSLLLNTDEVPWEDYGNVQTQRLKRVGEHTT